MRVKDNFKSINSFGKKKRKGLNTFSKAVCEQMKLFIKSSSRLVLCISAR